jgi:hypothetical protein
MLSRRSFLKLSGLAAVTLGAGYKFGNILSELKETSSVSLYGFLPDNNAVIKNVFDMFNTHLNKNSIASVVVHGNSGIAQVIYGSLKNKGNKSLLKNNSVVVTINKLGKEVQSDIHLRNEGKIVSPEKGFDAVVSDMRNSLKHTNARYFFTAEFKEYGVFSYKESIKNVAVIENEKGVVDKVSLNRNLTDVNIKGNAGNTLLAVGNGSAHVKSASCRNKLCMHSGHLLTSSTIACAPNKIIIRLETA